MKYFNIILVTGLLVGASSCKNSSQDSSTDRNKTEQTQVVDFPAPEIPIMLTNVQDRGAYLSLHFWEKLNPNDTAIINNKEIIEQKWVNYLDILAKFQADESPQLIEQLITRFKSNPTAYLGFNQLADKYLYEADSPFRNDPMYVAVLKVRLQDENITDTEKEQIKYKIDICSKNNVGSKAENISFTTSTGKTEQLYKIETDYTILFFNDLDCNLCANATEELRNSELITSLEKKGRLKIVTINMDDDFTAWKKKVSRWPKTWINGYDGNMNIVNNNSYDLRAIPSFYLLDKNKEVVLKDKPLANIMEILVKL